MVNVKDIMMRAHREVMDDYLALAEEFGIGLEFGDFCRPAVLADPDEYNRRLIYVKERVLPLGLKKTLHTPFKGINPHSIESGLRNRSRELITRSLETAQELGCSLAVIHSAYDDKNCGAGELDRAADDFIPYLEDLLKQFDLDLCLENIHDRDTSFLDRLAAGIDDSRLGFCLDVGHMSAFGALTFADWYRDLGPRTIHNHWHDNRGDRDAHGPLGSGSVDWHEITRLHETYCPSSTIALEIPYGEGIRQSLKTLDYFLS